MRDNSEENYFRLTDLNGHGGLIVESGTPEVVPEAREALPKKVSRKSRLAVFTAFYYLQHPEEVDGQIIDVDSYLNLIVDAVETANEEMLKFLQNSGLSPEYYLQEMSDEEIKSTIQGWKAGQAGDEYYEKQCDEYLEYILDSKNVSGAKKEANKPTPASAETAPLEFDINSVTIDQSRLPYKLKATISGKEKNPYFINLPPAAQTATPEELQKYAEAFKQVLAETNGKFYPRLAVQNKKLVVGVGPSAKRDTWQVVDEFTVDELVDITGKPKQEIENYLLLRVKNYTKLTEPETKTRDDFEYVLNNSEMNVSSGKGANFKQSIKDYAVFEKWIALVGEDRYQELKSQPLPPRAEKNANRWSANDELLNNPEFVAKAKFFLLVIKTRFNSYEQALGHKSILSELAKIAGLKGTEVLYLLGKEVLTGERQEFLPEYEKLFNSSSENLKQLLKDRPLPEMPDGESPTKAQVLKYTLLGYVRANPISTDIWQTKKFVEPLVKTLEQAVPWPELFKKELKHIPEIKPEIFKEDGLFSSLDEEALDRIFNGAFPQG